MWNKVQHIIACTYIYIYIIVYSVCVCNTVVLCTEIHLFSDVQLLVVNVE